MCGHECMADEPCEHIEQCLAVSRVSSIEEAQRINTQLMRDRHDERKEVEAE